MSEELVKRKMEKIEFPESMPIIPIREMIVYPSMVLPLAVGRIKSIKALEESMATHRYVLVITQKNVKVEEPEAADLYSVGTICEILQILKMPDGTLKALVEGLTRVQWDNFTITEDGFIEVNIKMIDERCPQDTTEVKAVMRNVVELFEQYVKLSPRMPIEIAYSVNNVTNPARLADIIAAHLIVKSDGKQEILEATNPIDRLEKIIKVLTAEIEILDVERKIQSRVRNQMDKSQRQYYLNEQMKAIKKELKQDGEDQKDVNELRDKIKAAKLPQAVREAAEKELARLDKMFSMSPEATVIRTYIEWILDLPWEKSTEDNLDLKRAQEILDQDHYGLEKVKDRILEYLAVLSRVKKIKGPILCFIGPPGVGKTSIAKSVARSLGRNFARISMGGVRDEAEIRGHRRTYIGSMPGKVIQSMKRAASNNPVFILDEIDKIGADWRGDPSSALLEVLDPEQNYAFADHYLDVDFDLSKVMFIATANSLQNIPTTLLDRLELIRFSGYTDEEKIKIARDFIIPKQFADHGITDKDLEIKPDALEGIIKTYTREAGVRNLTREIANLCRKAAKELEYDKNKKRIVVADADLEKMLGVAHFERERISENDIGVVTGLAWTEVGGETLTIEVNKMKGKGILALTGKLGDVMKESAQAALTYVRSSAKKLGIDDKIFKETDFHVHVPEGAVPKDGPSAGIALTTALASVCLDKPVKKKLAMTGEVTLRGRVLAIGGLKEKVLAAYREGADTVLFPIGNKKDLVDIPKKIKDAIKMIPVAHMDEVLKLAIENTKNNKKNGGSKK